jgi:hypothetical protein
MSYADIGRLMDCSEIGARALFYRAKKALTGRLSRHGLGKGALGLALVLFGKMTAASKATAAEISITASTLSVGPTATLLATATSKAGILTLAAVAVVGVGSLRNREAENSSCQAENVSDLRHVVWGRRLRERIKRT